MHSYTQLEATFSIDSQMLSPGSIGSGLGKGTGVGMGVGGIAERGYTRCDGYPRIQNALTPGDSTVPVSGHLHLQNPVGHIHIRIFSASLFMLAKNWNNYHMYLQKGLHSCGISSGF